MILSSPQPAKAALFVLGAYLFSAGIACAQTLPGNTDSSIHFVGSKYYPPLEWSDDAEQTQGFFTEIRQAMAATTQTKLEIRLLRWEDAINQVKSGQANAIALIPSAERSKYFDFTEPFYYIAHGIYSHRSGPQYGQLDQLKGRTVAVAQGAFAQTLMQQIQPDFKVIAVASELACITVVAERIADACVEVIVSSNHLAAMYDLPVELTSPPFWPQPYVFAVKKGDQATLSLLNQQLGQIVVDGTYKTIYQKWERQLEWTPQSIWDDIRAVSGILFGLLILISALWAWTWILKRQVAARTLQLYTELQLSYKLQLQVAHQARFDTTTNLLNRSAFFEELDNDMLSFNKRSQHSLSVISVQIANLSEIITAFGYNTALRTMSDFANRISQISDSKAGHFGAGQFVIRYHGAERAMSIIDELRQPLFANSNALEPHLIFGVATTAGMTGKALLNGAELVRRAITALATAAKKRETWFEYDESIEPDSQNLQLINDFHKCGCEQFVLYYQPQLDLATHRISHAEALIRWNHPILGLIPPFQFIPLLEQSGMIKMVSRWVITEAVAMIQRNNLGSKNIIISVNITTRDLLDQGFVEFIAKVTAPIEPSGLILEVTESDLFDDAGQAKQVMKALNALGIKCAVDDYGTGYSSLSYLNDLAVHEVKLDRSFVSNICENERSYKIVQSTINLAHELELIVVAEGVENQSAFDKLIELDCDRIQGFHVSKPMPEAEFLRLISLD